MERETYTTVDDVEVGPNDSVWFAAIDLDSYNYIPKEMTAKDAIRGGQTAFWSNYEDCLNECEDANSL